MNNKINFKIYKNQNIINKNNRKRKVTKKMLFNICTFLLVFFLSQHIYATSDPTLVNKLNTVFKKLESYLVKLATPIAGVAIGVGVMMRKLSFGDEEKMIKGKKTIINAIMGYAIIISINLIIKFIDALLG